MPQLSSGEFEGLAKRLGTEGGFTVDPRTGKDVTSGISVAPRDNEAKFNPATGADIESYTAGNADRFERGRATHLGGWRGPDGTDFLDTPTVHPHTPGGGGHARARKQMILSHQIASFDLDSFTEEYNPFHPEGRKELGMEPHEIATGAQAKPGESPERARQRSEWAAQQPEVQAWVNAPRGLRGL